MHDGFMRNAMLLAAPMRTHFDLCVRKYLLSHVISPSNDLLSRMRSFLAEYPEVDLRVLGVPSGNWQDEPLWNTRNNGF